MTRSPFFNLAIRSSDRGFEAKLQLPEIPDFVLAVFSAGNGCFEFFRGRLGIPTKDTGIAKTWTGCLCVLRALRGSKSSDACDQETVVFLRTALTVVGLGGLDVMTCCVANPFPIRFGRMPDDFSRYAHDDRIRWNHGSFRDQGSGGDQAARPDNSVVQDGRPDSDHDVIFDGCTVNDGGMAQSDAIADATGLSGISVDQAMILHIGFDSDPDRFRVAPDDCLKPDAGPGTDFNLPTDNSAGDNDDRIVDPFTVKPVVIIHAGWIKGVAVHLPTVSRDTPINDRFGYGNGNCWSGRNAGHLRWTIH